MKKTILTVIAVTMALFSSLASAQYKVATGDPEKGSVYAAEFMEYAKVCPIPGLQMVKTNGTVDNFNLLADNQVNGAFVQADIAFFNKKNDPDRVRNLVTVAGMHREALLFVARSSVTSGGVSIGKMNLFGNTKQLNTLSDARGMKIGAAGGSFESAKIVNAVGALGMEPVRFADNPQLVAALREGKIDVALFVGGLNYKPVRELSREFKLLTVSDDIVKTVTAAVPGIYTTMNVTYRNLEQTGIRTLNTQALWMTQNYTSPKMVATINAIRKCFDENVEDIAETTGTNPSWRDVRKDNNGNWPMFKFQ